MHLKRPYVSEEPAILGKEIKGLVHDAPEELPFLFLAARGERDVRQVGKDKVKLSAGLFQLVQLHQTVPDDDLSHEPNVNLDSVPKQAKSWQYLMIGSFVRIQGGSAGCPQVFPAQLHDHLVNLEKKFIDLNFYIVKLGRSI